MPDIDVSGYVDLTPFDLWPRVESHGGQGSGDLPPAGRSRTGSGGRPGERPMVPGFGISDPTFAGVDLGEIAAQVDLWGPRVELVDVTLDVDHADNSTRVSMRFR